jgi:hypothetical protein
VQKLGPASRGSGAGAAPHLGSPYTRTTAVRTPGKLPITRLSRNYLTLRYNGKMRNLALLSAMLVVAFSQALQAQNVTVKGESTPDESTPQPYMVLDKDCRALVSKRDDPTKAVEACKLVADEADRFDPKSHFIVRRGAYVFYTTALIQAKRPQDAVAVGDKAVAVVLLGHDDASGSSAAYGVRGQAKAFAGDLDGSSQDLEKAETFERNGLNSPAGKELSIEYSRTLKGLLMFHAQVLKAMGKQDIADLKLGEAGKL